MPAMAAHQPPKRDYAGDQCIFVAVDARRQSGGGKHEHEADAEHDRPHVQLRAREHGRSRTVVHQADDDEDQADQHRRGAARHQVEFAPMLEHRRHASTLLPG